MRKSAKKILLVEDDPSLLKLYQIKLTMSGYKVVSALNGQECLQKVGKCKPDIILLDIILPKIDGFTVLRALKSKPQTKKIPVILLTNLGQDEDLEKGKKLGAAGYWIKSNFTPSEITKKVEEVLKS